MYLVTISDGILNWLQIEELQDILDPSSSEDEDTPSPNSTLTRSSNHEEFLFGFHSISHSLRNYHPHAEKIPVFWDVYQENVAPLVTVLHKQIAKRRLMEAAQRPDAMDKNSEALIFAIYLITVVSMSSEECLEKLGESRDAAVKRYRFATEQALAKANFLNTQSLLLLQAAVMFLIGVRREDDTRFVWSMTSLVLRLAQGLGLHRDGTNFGLSPFETEMRRRLWWHICLLDIRSSEDHGTDFQICEKLYDTKLPLNVNDDDLFPDMKTPPSEHVGCTDMTFCLIRFEIITALRQVNGSSPNVRFHLDNPQLSPGHCGKMIQAINNRIEERYIQYCDMNNPLHWVCATVARVILAKLWLIVHHPMARRNLELNLTHASRESLFITSIEFIEYAHLMESNASTAKWGWMSQTNTPWHAIAFALSELCVRPASPLTDRAWQAVSTVYKELDLNSKQKKGMLWRPLSGLMKRAAAFRAEQLGQMQTQPGNGKVPEQPVSANPQESALAQPIPQITPTPQAAITQPAEAFGTDGALDFDISKGPIGILADMFPDTDLLSDSNAFDTSIPQPPFASAGAPINMPQAGMTSTDQTMLMPNAQLNWDDWDQVMRDFQMDVQNTEAAHRMDSTSDWLA